MVKVSVVVPVYNASAYLAQCMDSLVRQTLSDIEVICINDGSTDDSSEILKKYAAEDGRFRVISQENRGLSAARNRGMAEAQGKYIGFVDADDWISSDFYEKLYQAAENFSADIVGAEIIKCYANKKKKMLSFKKETVVTDVTQKFKLFHIPEHNYVCNKIYARDFICEHQFFFKEGVYYEDMFWLAPVVARSSIVAAVPKAAYFYRYNEKSIVNTTKGEPQKERDFKAARQFLRTFIVQNNIEVELPYDKKVKFHIFGFPLLKVLEGSRYKKYYFCGVKFMQAQIVSKV